MRYTFSLAVLYTSSLDIVYKTVICAVEVQCSLKLAAAEEVQGAGLLWFVVVDVHSKHTTSSSPIILCIAQL